jgi:hypothetical protein
MSDEIQKENNQEVGTEKIAEIGLTQSEQAMCFVGLVASIMGEFMMSGDTKYFLFHRMYGFLEKNGFTLEQIERVKNTMILISQAHKPNDFMG